MKLLPKATSLVRDTAGGRIWVYLSPPARVSTPVMNPNNLEDLVTCNYLASNWDLHSVSTSLGLHVPACRLEVRFGPLSLC